MRSALAVLVVAMSTSAEATPITYACKLIAGQNQSGMFGDVDQMVVDTDAKVIDLRVARTIGTDNPANWLFLNRISYDGSQEIFTFRELPEGGFVASGSDGAGAYAFLFSGGYLSFGVTYDIPAMAYTWECSR